MTKTRRAATVLWAAGLIAAAGCSSSDDAASGPADAAAFCRQLVAAEVDRALHCDVLEAPPEIYAMFFDCAAFAEAQAEGRAVYDASAAAECLAAIRGTSCWELTRAGFLMTAGSRAEACRAALVPQVEPGGACKSLQGFECRDGYCQFDSFEACLAGGTCVPLAAPGAECSTASLSSTCTEGYSCEWTCVDDACQDTCVEAATHVAVGLGETCTDEILCEDPYYCASVPEAPGTFTCQPRAAAGQSCGEVACRFGTWCMDGTCTAPLQAGADCSSLPEFCALGLYCNEQSVCARSPTAGESCDSGAACVDSWCDGSEETAVCKPYRAPGTVCGLSGTFEDEVLSCGPGYLCMDVETDGEDMGVCARLYCPLL